ncbi:MAG: hypothetical protein ACREMY_19850 [bacterium]
MASRMFGSGDSWVIVKHASHEPYLQVGQHKLRFEVDFSLPKQPQVDTAVSHEREKTPSWSS